MSVIEKVFVPDDSYRIEYIITEDEGVVVAHAYRTDFDNRCKDKITEWLYSRGYNIYQKPDMYNACTHEYIVCMFRSLFAGIINKNEPDEYKVVVKCNPEDTFDRETGMNIARRRLLRKVDRTQRKIIKDCLGEVLWVLEGLWEDIIER